MTLYEFLQYYFMYLILIDVTMSSYSITLCILVSYRCHYMSSYSIPLFILVSYRCHYMSPYSIPLCILVSYRCHYEFLQYYFMYLILIDGTI